MLGKEWTREYFNDYVIWLENTLFKVLQKDSGELTLETIKKELDLNGISQKDEFLDYFIQSNNNERYPESAFLLDVNYIDNCKMTDFYFSLLENDSRIVVDQEDKIQGLKLLLSEFLYQCGYNEALVIQNKILNKQKSNRKNETRDREVFDNVEAVSKDGEKKIITVFYGTLRNRTTWYAKRGKVSSKIEKSKNGKFIYMEGKKMMEIVNDDVISYISKDYD